MMLSLLLAFQLCPVDATAAGSYASVGALRTNGMPFTNAVYAGEPLLLVMRLNYLPFDPISFSPLASYYGGKMRLSVNGQWHDLTPADGVPRIGPPSCDAWSSFGQTLLYYPRTPEILLRGEYTEGETGVPGITVSAASVGVVRVLDKPLRIQRQASGARLWFYGTGANYVIERSANLRAWTEVGVFSPDAEGRIELAVTGNGFWRYRRN